MTILLPTVSITFFPRINKPNAMPADPIKKAVLSE